MKKKVLRIISLSLVSLMATYGIVASTRNVASTRKVAPTIASAQKKPSAVQRTKSFFQKHKGKIMAGAAAAAAIGTVVALGYHTDKTMMAIEKAGLGPDDDLFGQAVAAVGLLGPIGMKRTIQLITTAVDRELITKKEAAALVVTDIGKALANYWGVTHRKYIQEAGFESVRLAAKQAKAAAQKAFTTVRSVFGK